MKSITNYIHEKLNYNNIQKEDYFEYILNIIKKKNLENIDTYDNGL